MENVIVATLILLLCSVVALSALNVSMFIKLRNLNYNLDHLSTRDVFILRQIQAFDGLKQTLEPLPRPLPALGGWVASPDFLFELATYARREKPEAILECSSGVSTVVLAQCCRLNGLGHVYSLEHEEKFARKTEAMLEEWGLSKWASVVRAPLVGILGNEYKWYNLEKLKVPDNGFEMLVIDGPPSAVGRWARYPALQILDEYLSCGAVTFLDDADRADERSIIRKWRGAFPQYKYERLRLEKGAARLYKDCRERSAQMR